MIFRFADFREIPNSKNAKKSFWLIPLLEEFPFFYWAAATNSFFNGLAITPLSSLLAVGTFVSVKKKFTLMAGLFLAASLNEMHFASARRQGLNKNIATFSQHFKLTIEG